MLKKCDNIELAGEERKNNNKRRRMEANSE
jgi:hypothetical protein